MIKTFKMDHIKIIQPLAMIVFIAYIAAVESYVSTSRIISHSARVTHALGATNIDPLLSSQENAMINLFEKVRPSVVYVSTFLQLFNPLLMNAMEVPSQSGSGFVWDTDGHIVTNYHVLGPSTSDVLITFINDDGSRNSWKAKVQGVDADKDIAVLKLYAESDNKKQTIEQVRPIQVGTSKNLRVGQFAIAIGNPFGLDQTLTTGIVSGLGRQVASPTRKPIYNMIQTDAAINPGNSGGPLLDSSGSVIGMNTAIYSTSGASAGIGFAIPVDTVKAVVDIIIRDGKVTQPATGILFYTGSNQAKILGVERGLVVVKVVPGSSAALAGMRGITRNNFSTISLGDIVTAVNDVRVDSESDFMKAIDGNVVGDTINISVTRYIEGAPTEVNGDKEARKRRAVETTMRLKLSK